MRITLLALGSRGDVQPYVALGNGLKDAGHTVRILTSSDFQELVTSYGLTFCDVGGRMEMGVEHIRAEDSVGRAAKEEPRMSRKTRTDAADHQPVRVLPRRSASSQSALG